VAVVFDASSNLMAVAICVGGSNLVAVVSEDRSIWWQQYLMAVVSEDISI